MTTPTKSYRLSTEALQKLERLATRNCRSQAQQLTYMINQAYKEIEMQPIDLIEDNAGGLYAGNEDVGWWVVGGCGVQFAEDAQCIASGDTDDWTIEHVTDKPVGNLIAFWRHNEVYMGATFIGGAQPGSAGREYLGI